MVLEWVLVIGTLVTGLILLGWTLARRRNSDQARQLPWFVDYARSFFPVLLVVLVLRSFVAEPFRIPSGSMMPTLLVGDFILVSKFSYGIRLPITRTEIWRTGRPERGDVAVFKYPDNPAEDYIKRVVGLPGDTIEFRGRDLIINGVVQPRRQGDGYTGVGSGRTMTGAVLATERLGDVEHDVLFWDQARPIETRVTVPEGHYFMVGDNRDNSNDSRMWGFVSEDLLVGKALFVWLNWDFSGGQFDASRIGRSIH
ncbi:MAG: signal peptidase I [Thioalkalivibrionaceae bacterium]